MEACGPTRHTFYVLDTNVLIHDPNALLNFEEHHVIIPMTVLEELDKLKSGKTSIAKRLLQEGEGALSNDRDGMAL